MSGGGPAPVVTPSTLVVEKEQVVVIEFRREIPRNSFLTLDVYYEGSSSKFATLPTALLGTRTVRAMFPVFPKPGVINVNVLLARDEDTRFPQFKIKVQSAIESLASSLPKSRGSRQVALFAAAVAYLANSEDSDREAIANADEVLCDLLKGIQPADLPDWTMAWFLCGKFSPVENLLHVFTRQSLTHSLDVLLQPWFIDDKAHYLLHKAHPDNKTPLDLAKKRNLVAVTEAAEQLAASGAMKVATPKAKKKFNITRASSIDSNLQHLVQDSPTSPVKKNKGKKAKKMIRQLFRSETKEKFNTPSPQHPTMDELQRRHSNFGGSSESLSSVTLPRNHRHSVLSTGTDSSTPGEPSVFPTAGREEDSFDEQRRMSQTLPRLDQQTRGVPSPKLCEQRPPQPLPGQSGDRLTVVETRGRPVSSLSSGYGSAVSNAVAELKEKALYKAEVVKQYKWESANCNDVILQVGDKVYVTQEIEDNMCLGVCNDRYCKFPKSVVSILSDYGVDDDLDDEHDYDRVVLPGASDEEQDDEDIYKVPRNVSRVASSDSESDDSDHIYDVPPNKEDILSYLISEGHYMKVPTRNSIIELVTSDRAGVSQGGHKTPQDTTSKEKQEPVNDEMEDGENDDGIYDVPKSVLRAIDDDHGKLQQLPVVAPSTADPSRAPEPQEDGENDDSIYDIPSSIVRPLVDEDSGKIQQPLPPAVSHVNPSVTTSPATTVPGHLDDSENDDGIYDVPSSIVRQVEQTTTVSHQVDDSSAEYDTLTPLAPRGVAKIADQHLKAKPSTHGWGYAEIKDCAPPRMGGASQLPGHISSVSAASPHGIQYADISDMAPSKRAQPVQRAKQDTPFTMSTIDSRKGSEAMASIPAMHTDSRAQEWGKSKRSSSEPHVIQGLSMSKAGNSVPYIEDSEEFENDGLYDIPSSPIKSIDEVSTSPKEISLPRRRETERSSESSETEERRNTDTPEGSEGSDVFVDLPLTATAKSKANSLPSSRHRSVMGGGGAVHPSPSQQGIPAGTSSPRSARTRIASEPAPQVGAKPTPARRTKMAQPPPSQGHPSSSDRTDSRFPDNPPSPALPPRDTTPPPPRPEKPSPVLHGKPPAPLAHIPPSLLPDVPPPPLPERSPPTVAREKPPAPLPPNDPPFEPGDKLLPTIPGKPPVGRAPAPAPGRPSEYQSGHHKAVDLTPSDAAPRPKPRRNIPSTKRDGVNHTHVEVRSSRSHTTADCTADSVNSSFLQPTHLRDCQESPRLQRPSRIKSSPEAQRHAVGNGSVLNGQSTQANTTHGSPTFPKGKAKVAAPPVARKPKPGSPNSSPIPGYSAREQLKPLTSPKPRRR